MQDEFVFDSLYSIGSGLVQWRSPSNIALIKYWGKKPIQIPSNPSLSFCLSNCFTSTKVSFTKNDKTGINYQFFFDGKKKPKFESKLDHFFEKISKYCPYILEMKMVIESSNSFPHSSGIASSASAFSALSLCIMEIENLLNPKIEKSFFFRKASFLSRLGSGSACRSIIKKFSVWGKTDLIRNSSDLFASSFNLKVHNSFNDLCDTILIVDKSEKEFSSTKGHELMNSHIFGEIRVSQAKSNLSLIIEAFDSGNYKLFIEVVETEALTLHAMMMTSNPYFILMKSNTLKIIKSVWEFRKKYNSRLCFTLDAGANVHLIYPKSEFDSVQRFILEVLVGYCENGKFINDKIGIGPFKL